ncbi:MAG: type II toxin-antitoxin system RelE/ParE family toxin [Gammaproteobacteria bacterium]|nr:MAG: type II toxin-antitoxin system RelE/ParE family toxin [Gammaproteobacteria bacterium]
MRYEFHPEAAHELTEAALRYESTVPSLGRRFLDEVERVIDVLLDHPEVGAPVDRELRHFILRRFPFSVVYACSGDVLMIVAIAHGSREPEYWRSRVHDR